MKSRMAIFVASIFALAGLLALAAGDASIGGVVTDAAGKPVRGAIVKATSGSKTVARYTDPAGRFQITGLKPGAYEVSAEAFGLGRKTQTKDAAQGGEIRSSLAPETDPLRLTSAEVEYLLPDTDEGKLVKSSCSGCHGFETVLGKRGMTAPLWQAFLPAMTQRKFGRNLGFEDRERTAALAGALGKFFGPGWDRMRKRTFRRSRTRRSRMRRCGRRSPNIPFRLPARWRIASW